MRHPPTTPPTNSLAAACALLAIAVGVHLHLQAVAVHGQHALWLDPALGVKQPTHGSLAVRTECLLLLVCLLEGLVLAAVQAWLHLDVLGQSICHRSF